MTMNHEMFDYEKAVKHDVVHADRLPPFVRKYKKPLFWLFILVLVSATYQFSTVIESRYGNAASVFFSSNPVTHQVSLSASVASPESLTMNKGDSVEFVVTDSSRHNMYERRSNERKGDARVASGEFGQGESYVLQFYTAGQYDFYDRSNQDISVTIIVK